ncbi:hypothetical protein Cadr_000009701 [Camelus dromedarius]|uniref:Uncharacterized protein n=1 Tax=Camelus dromedarius TaxID=9838 RepID=A0A5N4DIG2_CAMDR|nr:hypothetical protein Cadr_000009701 [Camelus dromedarius]
MKLWGYTGFSGAGASASCISQLPRWEPLQLPVAAQSILAQVLHWVVDALPRCCVCWASLVPVWGTAKVRVRKGLGGAPAWLEQGGTVGLLGRSSEEACLLSSSVKQGNDSTPFPQSSFRLQGAAWTEGHDGELDQGRGSGHTDFLLGAQTFWRCDQ